MKSNKQMHIEEIVKNRCNCAKVITKMTRNKITGVVLKCENRFRNVLTCC